MPPKLPKCSCLKHTEFVKEGLKFKVYNIETSKKYNKPFLRQCYENGFLTSRCMYLCDLCAEHIKQISVCENSHGSDQGASASKKFHSSTTTNVDTILSNLFDHLVSASEQECNYVYQRIGKFLQQSVFTNAFNISQNYKDVVNLSFSNPKDMLNVFDSNVLHLVCGLTNTEVQTASRQKLMCLISTLEHILYLRNSNTVLPMCFVQNIISYFSTRSRKVLETMNITGPHGSYTTCQQWLAKQSEVNRLTNKVDSQCNNITFFDNCQKVGRTWHIHLNNKVVSNTFTSVIHLSPEVEAAFIQSAADLSPSQWLYPLKSAEELLPLMVRHIEEADATFRYTLKNVLYCY